MVTNLNDFVKNLIYLFINKIYIYNPYIDNTINSIYVIMIEQCNNSNILFEDFKYFIDKLYYIVYYVFSSVQNFILRYLNYTKYFNWVLQYKSKNSNTKLDVLDSDKKMTCKFVLETNEQAVNNVTNINIDAKPLANIIININNYSDGRKINFKQEISSKEHIFRPKAYSNPEPPYNDRYKQNYFQEQGYFNKQGYFIKKNKQEIINQSINIKKNVHNIQFELVEHKIFYLTEDQKWGWFVDIENQL